MSRDAFAEDRYMTAGRRLATVALIGVTLAACSLEHAVGLFELAALAETVELYFTSGDFERDVRHAVDFSQKVLGSGGL